MHITLNYASDNLQTSPVSHRLWDLISISGWDIDMKRGEAEKSSINNNGSEVAFYYLSPLFIQIQKASHTVIITSI